MATPKPLKPCKHCGCTYAVRGGPCPACAEDATSDLLRLHAANLLDICKILATDPRSQVYVPALESGIASLKSDARNHKHVARCLRRLTPDAPTVGP